MTTVEQLKQVGEILLDEQADYGLLYRTCNDFFDLGEAISGIGEHGTEALQTVETILPNGKAVSPLSAARCVREFARTSRFVSGLYAALLEAQRRFPGQTIHTLYAGCGPYATLILPLLLILPRDAFYFTLVDIHPLALESARKVIGHFGFDHFIRDYMLADACDASFADRQPIHVAVTETMNQAMDKEPQLAVSANLENYLEADGILVPEQITVRAALIDSSCEFVFLPSGYQGEIPPLQRRRLELGPVMVLDRAMLQNLNIINSALIFPGIPFGLSLSKPDGICPSTGSAQTVFKGRVNKSKITHLQPVTLPWPDKTVRNNMRPALLTQIRVFGSHVLECYDSSLTCPKFLRINEMPDEAGEWEFSYRLGDSPGFDYRFI